MKRLLLLALLLLPLSAFGQSLAGVNGDCQIGGQQTLTSGLPSTGTQQINTSNVNQGAGVQASFPACLVTVYNTGTVTKASIYSNNNPTPTTLTNPFTANTDGSYTFFVGQGACYDILISSGSTPLPYSRTLADVCLGTGSGGGSGGGSFGPFTVNTLLKANTSTSISSATCTDDGVSPTACSTGLNLVGSALLESKTNNPSTGTTSNLLVARDSSGRAINAQPTDANNIIGVAAFNAGTTGSVTYAVAGNFPLLFDNQTGIGDYVTLGSASQGHDSGAVQPAGRNYGRITSVNAGPGTLANVDLDMSSNGGTSSGGSGIVSNCSVVGGVFYAQAPGTTASCDPLFTTDGAGNVTATSLTTNGTDDGSVQVFDSSGASDNSLLITSSGGDSEIDWLDGSSNVIGDIAFRSAFGNVRIESHAATAARNVSYVIISDPTEIASTCSLGVQEGCILIDSLNTNFAFSAGLAANHSGGAMWQGDVTGRTWVGVPDNAGNNFIFWPLVSGTVAINPATLTTGAPMITDSTGQLLNEGGVIDCNGYVTLSHATKLQTCINDAMTAHAIADARGFGSDTFSVEIDFGDSSGDAGAILLPVFADWKTSVTNGTSCGFKHFRNFIIVGPSTSYNNMIMETNNISTSVSATFCDDTVDGYYQASGFLIKNTLATNASGYGAVFQHWIDNSYLRDVNVFDYVNKVVDFAGHICCATLVENMNVFGNNTSGDLIHIDSNGSSNAMTFLNLSAGHAGTGKKHIVIAEANTTTPSLTVSFLGQLYMEHNSSDITTSCVTISSGVAYHFANIQCGNVTASQTEVPIEILNVTPAPVVVVDSGRFNFSGVTNPAIFVKNDITGINCPLTDANGFFGGCNTATMGFGAVKSNTYATSTNCAAAGSAANPSLVACSAAASGSFSCSTSASTGTCSVATTAVTTNSRIFVAPSAAEGSNLSVTCNTTADTGLTTSRIASKTNGTGFVINLGAFSTNPECFNYWVVN